MSNPQPTPPPPRVKKNAFVFDFTMTVNYCDVHLLFVNNILGFY